MIFNACQHRDVLTGLHLLSQRDEHLHRPRLCALLRAGSAQRNASTLKGSSTRPVLAGRPHPASNRAAAPPPARSLPVSDRRSHANLRGRDGWFHRAPVAKAGIVNGVGDRRRYSRSYKSAATTPAGGSAQRRCCCGRPKLATPVDGDLELLVLAVA